MSRIVKPEEALWAQEMMVKGRQSLEQVLKGNPEVCESAIKMMACGKHLLLTSLVGMGKTILGKAVARLIVDGTYGRVSCTPDLLPGDIIGRKIWNAQLQVQEVEWGKAMLVMSLLLDELNRASEKTQSAVLEPLEEGQITIAGQTVQLPPVHFAVATRNPIENKGTFPLSEAVLDRFWMEETLRAPRGKDFRSLAIDTELHKSNPTNPAVFTVEQLLKLRELVEAMVQNASEAVTTYCDDLMHAVRTDEPDFDKLTLEADQGPRYEFDKFRIGKNAGKTFRELRVVKEGPSGEGGISPRGMAVAQMWVSATQALFDGRTEILCQDVYDTFLAVNRHRLAMNEMARVDRITSEDVLRSARRLVKMPSK